jgi:hypothetical protein
MARSTATYLRAAGSRKISESPDSDPSGAGALHVQVESQGGFLAMVEVIGMIRQIRASWTWSAPSSTRSFDKRFARRGGARAAATTLILVWGPQSSEQAGRTINDVMSADAPTCAARARRVYAEEVGFPIIRRGCGRKLSRRASMSASGRESSPPAARPLRDLSPKADQSERATVKVMRRPFKAMTSTRMCPGSCCGSAICRRDGRQVHSGEDVHLPLGRGTSGVHGSMDKTEVFASWPTRWARRTAAINASVGGGANISFSSCDKI